MRALANPCAFQLHWGRRHCPPVANGKPVIEARLASGSAIFSNSMSGGALSVAAKKSIHFLLGLGVAAATFSIVAGTCGLEVVGAIVP